MTRGFTLLKLSFFFDWGRNYIIFGHKLIVEKKNDLLKNIVMEKNTWN
jgi:hypothetical protein